MRLVNWMIGRGKREGFEFVEEHLFMDSFRRFYNNEI